MKVTNHETENLFAPFLTGMALAVVLGSMVALSTPAFALGGGGGGGGPAPAPAPAPEITKVDDPVAEPGEEVAEVRKPAVESGGGIPDDKTSVSESRTKEPEEKTLAVEDPDEDKTENKPDERTTEFPEHEVVEATVGFAALTSSLVEEGGSSEIQVRISKPLPQPLALNVSAAGTATEDEDYKISSASLTIPAGATSGRITLISLDDDIDEANETVMLTLAGTLPEGVTFGTATHIVTIIDDDVVEATVGFAESNPMVVREGKDAEVKVGLSAPLSEALTLSLRVGGTATEDSDFVLPGTVTFPRGSRVEGVVVSARGDVAPELDETITITLEGNLPNGVTFDVQTRTIVIPANDNTVTFSAPSSAHIAEEGGIATITANIEQPMPGSFQAVGVTVVPGGGAVRGTDYRLSVSGGSLSGNMWTLPTQAPNATLTVEAIGNSVDSEDKTLTLGFVGAGLPDGWSIGSTHTHTITIADDDVTEVDKQPEEEISEVAVTSSDETGTETEDKTETKPDERTTEFPNTEVVAPTVGFTTSTSEVSEGVNWVSIGVRVTPPVSEAIRLNYEYTGSAKRGKRHYEKQDGDYQDEDYTVWWDRPSIPENTSYAVAAVRLIVFDDVVDEDDETFTVTISGELPSGVKFGTRTHTVTIVDDDDGGTGEHATVGFARPATDFNEDVGSVAVEVVISEPLDEPLTVSYGSRPPAHSDRQDRAYDIYLHGNSLTFQPGETSKSFLFDIADDRIDELGVETAVFTLSGDLPEGVRFGRKEHVFLGDDNDTSDSLVEDFTDGTYAIEYNGEADISLVNEGHVVKMEARHLKVRNQDYKRSAKISIENLGTVDTDIVARNHVLASDSLISIKNGAAAVVGGNVIGKHHGEGNILIENRGSIAGDIRAVHFETGDIVIENHKTGSIGEDIEATHYGNGDISITNRENVREILLNHLGNGVVRFNGDISGRLNIVGNYEGSDDTQLNFHVDSDGSHGGMHVEGDVTGQSRVSLIVDENATVGEDTHFGDLIEVVEGYDAEANSFAGEQTIGAFNYVLEYDNEQEHAWSFVNKGLSETAEQSAKIPDDIEKDMKDPSKPKLGPDGKPKLGLWGGLDSSHTDIGLGFPAFVSSDDYHVGSQVQYYIRDDRTGIRALVETEYNFDVMNFRFKPYARLTWTRVGFEDFVGPHRERISLVDGDTVDLRLGLSFDNEYRLSNGFASAYGGLFMQTPIDGKTSVRVSGVNIASEQNDVAVDGILGFTHEWDANYSVNVEASRSSDNEARADMRLKIKF